MNSKIKNVIHFLFPEYQIIKIINEYGFISKKKNSNQFEKNVFQVNSRGEAIPFTQYASNNLKNQKQSPISRPKNISLTKKEDIFDELYVELKKSWITSEENVKNLCLALKRPYLFEIEGSKPRTNILLIGSNSCGKFFSIKEAATILKNNKVFEYTNVSYLDMKNYKQDNQLFLNDLYKGLYTSSEIIVFDNIEKIPPQNLSILEELMETGTYALQKRYIYQNNMLIEANALNTNSISELYANNKYFIFLSTEPKTTLFSILGKKFNQLLNDIIVLNQLSKSEIETIIKNYLESIISKIKINLNIELNYDVSLLEYLITQFDFQTGINGIQKLIKKIIYNPIAEYCLQNKLNKKQGKLIFYKDKIILQIDEENIDLEGYSNDFDSFALASVKQDLDQIIGLSNVKEYIYQLENNVKVQKMRTQNNLPIADISMHMIFTGNPGTGKTTIARIISKFFRAIGILSSGHLVEVSRADLVGQYVGETAILTRSIVKSAIGGVLFIDEAYSLCRDKNDVFGREALDTLVKEMEDNRKDLIVIFAGYDEEMKELLKNNPGLQSRFPNIIHFDDYTPDEMLEIAKITAQSKGYTIEANCDTALLNEFSKKQIKGKNESGNGRLVRNLIEAAIIKQASRVTEKDQLDLLTKSDFSLDQTDDFDLEFELSKIIGLENIKDFVRSQYNMVLAQEKRKKSNLKIDNSQSLNMIFTGNPGTGKTTVALVISKMFHKLGILKTGQLVEVSKSDFISEYVGQTSKKTEEIFKSALGGVLFIDEAYSLSDNSSCGQECINTLVKLIEDYHENIVVILAGYTKEMTKFMKSNSGLHSRFPLQIEFKDYNSKELLKIAHKIIKDKGFILSKNAEDELQVEIEKLKKSSTSDSGNGRMIRNYIEEIIRKQSNRIATKDVDIQELNVIIEEDIQSEKKEYDLEIELNKIIGLEKVKAYIKSLNMRLKLEEARKNAGLKSTNIGTLHMIFTGNPGTGKTMMARMIANLLYNMGIISSNKLIEVDRSHLVAGFVGQTAIKTREVIERAFGGVLFIDEAYSLAQGGDNDFGKEAIDTLVKMMDDNRNNLVVILAGYQQEMEKFLKTNIGLQSRFPNVIHFDDYNIEELLAIAEKMYIDNGYKLSKEAKEKLKSILENATQEKYFSNGRFVRNIFENSLNNQALRLTKNETLNNDSLITIIADDIKGGI